MIELRDDPAARRLLQRVHGAFQKWPEGFAGFHATVRCRTATGDGRGTVTVRGTSAITIDLDRPAFCPLVATMLREIAHARTPRFFKDAEGRFPVAFAADDDTVGCAIVVDAGTGERVRYRLDAAGRLREREHERDGIRVTTRFEAFCRAVPGRVLPVRTVAAFVDVASSTLLRTEATSDEHVRVEHAWLPASRRVVVTDVDGSDTIVVDLDDHRLI